MESKDSIFPTEMDYGETDKKSEEQEGIPPHGLVLAPLPCGQDSAQRFGPALVKLCGIHSIAAWRPISW